jgi:archaellum component FlaC
MITPQTVITGAQTAALALLAVKNYLDAVKNDLTDESIKELDTLAIKYKTFFLEKTNNLAKEQVEVGQSEEAFIPLNFQHEGKKPKVIPADSTINPLTYHRLYGNNLITPYAISIINLICAYQQGRLSRPLDRIRLAMPGQSPTSYLCDSRGQFCFFLKSLMVEVTKQDLTDPNTLQSVNKLLRFIVSIQNDNSLFLSSGNGMKQLLARIGKHLGQTIQIIDTQEKIISARDLIKQLTNSIQMSFYYGIDVAMRAISSTLPNYEANLISITVPDLKINGYIENENLPLLNQYISKLALTYPVSHKSREKHINPRECIFSFDKTKNIWHGNLPSLKDTKGIAKVDFSLFNDYIKFLALLEQFAINSRYVSLSYKLSADLGNLGIYYQMGESTNQLCEIVKIISKNLQEIFSNLENKLSEILYKRRVDSGNDDDPWCVNIKYINDIKDQFNKLLDNVINTSASIQDQYVKLTKHTSQITEEIETDMAMYISGIDSAAQYVSEIGIGYSYQRIEKPGKEIFFTVDPNNGKIYTNRNDFIASLPEVHQDIKNDIAQFKNYLDKQKEEEIKLLGLTKQINEGCENLKSLEKNTETKFNSVEISVEGLNKKLQLMENKLPSFKLLKRDKPIKKLSAHSAMFNPPRQQRNATSNNIMKDNDVWVKNLLKREVKELLEQSSSDEEDISEDEEGLGKRTI